MKPYKTILLSLLILPLPLLLGSCEKEEEIENTRWVLDEFDTPTPDNRPDPSKWTYEKGASGYGNQELQNYTDRVENASYTTHKGLGCLKITALNDNYDGVAYSSARIKTEGLFEQRYGRFEARLKLPYGPGLWPAFWMLGANYATDVWPKCGEIDIMENVGYDPDTIVGSSHTEKYNHAIGTQKNAKIACPDCYKAFHVYALEWEEDEYRLYVDDQLYFTFKNEGIGYEVWPYDKRFHILLNLAIGGNWGGQKGIDDSLFPHVFEIDYVRVYKK